MPGDDHRGDPTRHPGTFPDESAAAPHRSEILQEMLRDERRFRSSVRTGNSHVETRGGTEASVEDLRLAVRDLKHDVRMLKVGLDKQGQVLDEIVATLRHLVETR